MKGALYYNENKVGKGVAELVLASNFCCDIDSLSFSEKLRRFNHLMGRNEKIKTNTLHLSLNFSPGESLPKDKLQSIALDYMGRIGFAEQPFLVYQHNDTSHPHIHIVTTSIKENGKFINLHNIAKLKSEPARKAIEVKYNLVRAEDQKRVIAAEIAQGQQQSPAPDKLETKRQVSNRVQEVMRSYKYGSLEQFNAILEHFRIVADPGKEGSRTHLHKGLVYYQLDPDGNKKGVGIKASAIYCKPTLAELEKRFAKNELQKLHFKSSLITTVNFHASKARTYNELTRGLNASKIEILVNATDPSDFALALYIDHKTKTVFSGLELGVSLKLSAQSLSPKKSSKPSRKAREIASPGNTQNSPLAGPSTSGLLSTLLANTNTQPDCNPGLFTKKRKRKKKKSI